MFPPLEAHLLEPFRDLQRRGGERQGREIAALEELECVLRVLSQIVRTPLDSIAPHERNGDLQRVARSHLVERSEGKEEPGVRWRGGRLAGLDGLRETLSAHPAVNHRIKRSRFGKSVPLENIFQGVERPGRVQHRKTHRSRAPVDCVMDVRGPEVRDIARVVVREVTADIDGAYVHVGGYFTHDYACYIPDLRTAY